MVPCQRCSDFLKLGVILMSVSDGDGVQVDLWCMTERVGGTTMKVPRPYRTGGWCVISPTNLGDRLTKVGLECETIIRTGWACLDDNIWDELRLPR